MKVGNPGVLGRGGGRRATKGRKKERGKREEINFSERNKHK